MARTVKRSISFDDNILRAAERAAEETTAGNLSALVGTALAEHVKVLDGRRLMRDDEAELGAVDAATLAAVDAEWPA